jgi:cell wall-associated NlpC family hydrolase
MVFSITIVVALTACASKKDRKAAKQSEEITIVKPANSYIPAANDKKTIASETDQPDSLIAFAKTLIGVPYLYACTDPQKGFDCSGFVTYVFNHFNIAIPRSSVDFTNYGREIDLEKARPGDLILFTGTDSSDLVVGHMGIVESTKDDTLVLFIPHPGKQKEW